MRAMSRSRSKILRRAFSTALQRKFPTSPRHLSVPYRVRYKSPRPAELDKPLPMLHHCASCSKYFGTERALTRHKDTKCSYLFACDVCGSRFKTKDNLRQHATVHDPARRLHRCGFCKAEYLSRMEYVRHLRRFPGPHERQTKSLHVELSEDLLSSSRFFRQRSVAGQSMHHVTFLRTKPLIESDRLVKARRNASMVMDGEALLREDAPIMAHFKVSPSEFGNEHSSSMLGLSSFVPQFAEPGELLNRLSLPLKEVLDLHTHRLYLAHVAYESPKRNSGVRGTVLVASERYWAWADEHCTRLDPHDNPVICLGRRDPTFAEAALARRPAVEDSFGTFVNRKQDSTSSPPSSSSTSTRSFTSSTSTAELHSGEEEASEPEWLVASRFLDESGDPRFFTVTLVVADGVSFEPEIANWDPVFRIHYDHGDVVCSLCSSKFKSYHDLTEHEQREHYERVFECIPCGIEFRDFHGLRSHVSSTHEGITHSCTLCDLSFSTSHGLQRHRRQRHEGSDFSCPLCERSFSSGEVLKQHERAAHSDDPFKCAHCSLSFQFMSVRSRHVNTAHRGARYQCVECGKAFLSQKALDAHSEESATSQCRHCNAELGVGRAAAYHSLARHGGMGHYLSEREECISCGKELATDAAHVCDEDSLTEGDDNDSGMGAVLEQRIRTLDHLLDFHALDFREPVRERTLRRLSFSQLLRMEMNLSRVDVSTAPHPQDPLGSGATATAPLLRNDRRWLLNVATGLCDLPGSSYVAERR